jgi:hypothetical protein
MVGELVGGERGDEAAVASVGEVTFAPYGGPRWDVAVACGGLKVRRGTR